MLSFNMSHIHHHPSPKKTNTRPRSVSVPAKPPAFRTHIDSGFDEDITNMTLTMDISMDSTITSPTDANTTWEDLSELDPGKSFFARQLPHCTSTPSTRGNNSRSRITQDNIHDLSAINLMSQLELPDPGEDSGHCSDHSHRDDASRHRYADSCMVSSTSSSSLSSFEDSDDVVDGMTPRPRTASLLYQAPCEDHPELQLALYCTECSQAICMMCKADVHTTHSTTTIAGAAAKRRSTLKEQRKRLKQDLNSNNTNLQALRDYEVDLQKKMALLAEQLDNQRQHLHHKIERWYDKMRMQMTSLCDAETSSVAARISQLQQDIVEQQELSEHIKQLLTYRQAADLLALSEDLTLVQHDRDNNNTLKQSCTTCNTSARADTSMYKLNITTLMNKNNAKNNQQAIKDTSITKDVNDRTLRDELMAVSGVTEEQIKCCTRPRSASCISSFNHQQNTNNVNANSVLNQCDEPRNQFQFIFSQGVKLDSDALGNFTTCAVPHIPTQNNVPFISKGRLYFSFDSRQGKKSPYMASGVQVNQYGEYIVTDIGMDQVHVFNVRGRRVSSLNTLPADDPTKTIMINSELYLVACKAGLKLFGAKGEFGKKVDCSVEAPQAITMTKGGNIVVTDQTENGSLIHILAQNESDFKSIHTIIGGKHAPCFRKPWHATTDADNNIIISDYSEHRVKVLSPYGMLTCEFGGKGCMPGQFFHPAGLCVDKYGHILVADSCNNRIQMFSSQGDFLSIILNEDDDLQSPIDLDIDKQGHLVVLQGNGVVKLYQYIF